MSFLHVFAVVCVVLASRTARASGHFDVDDASTLDPGQCQSETWATRSTRNAGGTFHVGPACRVGPIELGASVDRLSGVDRANLLALQFKWTFWGDRQSPLTAALSFSPATDLVGHGKPGRHWVLPVTWRATETLQIHANVGADWATGEGARTRRLGAQTEWAATERWALIAERHRANEWWTTRVGARISLTAQTSVDVSAARSNLRGVQTYAVGFNHQFSR